MSRATQLAELALLVGCALHASGCGELLVEVGRRSVHTGASGALLDTCRWCLRFMAAAAPLGLTLAVSALWGWVAAGCSGMRCQSVSGMLATVNGCLVFGCTPRWRSRSALRLPSLHCPSQGAASLCTLLEE